ncbi:hypothetical protein ABZ807_12160 [Micromonospora sp. NPDC047548]|uniref:hypothetical protein n=1 Tax=Micromonospora sp. NPDC047548 TaxID=3155624 RepID=UPI00340917DE
MYGRQEPLARPLFRPDWLPDGMTHRTCSSRRREQSLIAWEGPPTGPMAGSRVVSVRVDSDVDVSATYRGWRSGPAVPVHGRPARLCTDPEDGHTSLSWKYAPDATVTVLGTNLPRPAETLRRIAEGLVWAEQPVRVPFLAVTPPDGARWDGTVVDWRDGRWHRARCGYRLIGSAGPHEDLTVGVVRDDPDGTTVAERTVRVDGAPSGLGTYRVGGLGADCAAEVAAFTIRGLAALGGPDGALALAATVRLVDRPGDESTWRLP